MANFYATYSASASSSATVTALQGTVPWVVVGNGVAGTPQSAVLTVQGNASGVPIPISGSITANNASVGATGAAVPASGTYIAASVAGTLTGLVATANGLKTDVIASVLPTGAATEATLAAASAKLPTTLGQKTMAASMAVVVASDQSAVPVSGTVAVTQSTSPWVTSGTSTVSGTVTANQGTSPWVVSGGGTAGAAAAGVVTVQGVASMTPVQVSQATASNLNATVSQATGTNLHTVVDSGTITTVSTVTAVTSITNTVTTDQVATTAATFQDGAILFSSLTTSFATVITTGGILKNVSMRNNANAVVAVSLDGGSTTSYTLDSGDALSLDLKILGLRIAASVALQAKYVGGAPTSGNIRINGVY